MTMRNSTGWATGARKGAGTSRLRRHGINLIMLGAFALVAGGAVSQIPGDLLPMAVLFVTGVAWCLGGWRMLVVGRRRERQPG